MDPDVRQRVLRQLTYGLYVVTARHGEQTAAGTINWVTQAAMDPPLVAVGMRSGSGIAVLSEQSGHFAVHVLGASQLHLAQAFFTPARVEGGRINGVPFRAGNEGMPILTDVPCAFECAVVDIRRPGDHDLVVGRVSILHDHHQQAPLTLASTGWYYGG